MERKIGEIFEYNGEWLQCVEQPEKYDKTVCSICAFQGNGNCELDRCSGTYRSDKKFVIFKKLEKVGEPYELYGHLIQKYRFFHSPAIQVNGTCISKTINTYNIIKIEIKQTKEDMEETKLNLKPFDIQKAREGKPVCTRDGRGARIICFNRESIGFPIIALIKNGDTEGVYQFDDKGRSNIDDEERGYDLMMLPEKKEGWVNIYALNTCYSSKEEAEANIDKDYEHEYVRTIKINWEE